MTITTIIQQCEIRLEYLRSIKISNIQLGNNDLVNRLDVEILELEETINKLREIVNDVSYVIK